MEKRKDVQLLFFLVVIMSMFNLVSMLVYVSGFDESSLQKKIENKEIAVDEKQGIKTAKTNTTATRTQEKTSLNVYDYLKNKFGAAAIQNNTTGDSSSQDDNADQDSIAENTDDSDASAPVNTTQNTSRAVSNNDENEDSDTSSDSGSDASNNDNNSSEDHSNPLDDEVPPNDTGPPAETVEGKDLQFHFSSGFK